MLPATSQEISKYTLLFEQLSPTDGKLDGEKCKKAMMKSQLSVETLGRVWDLSDIDNDGCLDLPEFILAMHLIHRCVEGDMLPTTLPQTLVPSGKERYFSHFHFTQPLSAGGDPFATPNVPSTMALVPLPKPAWSDHMGLADASQFSPLALVSHQHYGNTMSTAFSPNMASAWSQFSAGQSFTFPPWALSAEEVAKASKVFSTIDTDADGLLTGAEVRDVLIRSGLQQSILAQIWELVDIHGTGMLNCEQFAVAMHLATEQLASGPYSRPLPTVLPPALVPPSLRPVPPDPAIFEESNKLIAEIEAINRERAEVETAYITLNMESQRRATETASVQRTVDALSYTSRSLVNQRNEAERRLTDYAHEKDALESILAELKGHVSSERQKVEEMRGQISSQQVSAKSQEEEIVRLRNEVNELIREETMLQDRVSESRRRMEAIEAENRAAQQRIDKATNRVTSLEATRSQLLEVLDQYTNLLNGTSTGPQPDESKVKALLNGSSLDDSIASFDTGFGGGSHGVIGAGPSRAFDDLGWSSDNVQREFGASSVPLPVTSSTNRLTSRAQPVSALGMPIWVDPFLGVDSFNTTNTTTTTTTTTATSAGIKAPFTMDKGFTEDPFGPTNLFSNSDPFKDSDPFGCDPFSLPSEKPKSQLDTTAFDPFATQNTITGGHSTTMSNNTIAASDFDALFGSTSTVPTNQPSDPFGADPFCSLELAAIAGTAGSAKKSPPPRPKTQPGAARSGRELKSLGSSPNPAGVMKSPSSIGSFPDFTDHTDHNLSKSAAGFNSLRQSKHRLSTGFMAKVRGGMDRQENRSNSLSVTGTKSHMKTADGTDWVAPVGLTEEEQLSLATMESRRLAQAEEQARRQEEADLELAIRLSQMDTAAS